jgi:hypothetical protein
MMVLEQQQHGPTGGLEYGSNIQIQLITPQAIESG